VYAHAQIASEAGRFDIDDVARLAADKLIGRHPHVFGDATADTSDAVIRNWELIKKAEKPHRESILDGVPRHLPALLKAYRVQQKVSRVGFDWERIEGIVEKLDEELAEFKEAVALEKDPNAFVMAEYLRASHEAGRFDDEAAAIAEKMAQAAGEPRATWGDLFSCFAQIWRDGARGYAYGYFREHAGRYPSNAVAFNNMAWLLATATPDDMVHARMDEWPAKGVEWAQRAVDLDEGKQAATAWDTLGAAKANAGDFAGAIEAATRGAELARTGGGLELAAQIEERLAGYRVGKPWRE